MVLEQRYLDEISAQFWTNGYAVIPDFLTSDQIDQLCREMRRIVESEHKGSKTHLIQSKRNSVNSDDARGDKLAASVFETGDNQTGDSYFIESGDKIRFFYEKEATLKFDANSGRVVLKSAIGENQIGHQKSLDIHSSLNKVGHALHAFSEPFKSITFDPEVQAVVKSVVGFHRPVIPQSMFIYKNPGIGGEVVPHQDGSFLFTEPDVKLLGLWIALEAATLENGCLWFIPGSHNDTIARRFIRNADFDSRDPESKPLIFTADAPNYVPTAFVAAPVAKGSLVLIHGRVVHKSEANRSRNARPAYTFHVIESDKVTWSNQNWLQPTSNLPFPTLYDQTQEKQK